MRVEREMKLELLGTTLCVCERMLVKVKEKSKRAAHTLRAVNGKHEFAVEYIVYISLYRIILKSKT